MSKLIMETKTVHIIDYCDLEEYLSDFMGKRIEMTESDNDVSHAINISKAFEHEYTTVEKLKATRDLLEGGSFPCWELNGVFSLLFWSEIIKEGDYVIKVSW